MKTMLHPLKRVGKRGEGKFQEISWEQAMQEIGAKLREIRDKYGPESVVVNTFWCGYPAPWAALHPISTNRSGLECIISRNNNSI
jgi:anaerobic selenocysteine-containing dehydrogenase